MNASIILVTGLDPFRSPPRTCRFPSPLQVGTVMVRWVSKHCDPVMATGWHMVLGSLPLAALSLAREGDDLLPRLAQIDGALWQSAQANSHDIGSI